MSLITAENNYYLIFFKEMATGGQDYDQRSYHARIISILVNCCLKAMRKVLETYLGRTNSTLSVLLQSNKKRLMKFELCKRNTHIIFPPNYSPDLESLDISLLALILINTCCRLPKNVVDALEALKQIRNDLFHSPMWGLEERQYKKIKSDILVEIEKLHKYIADPLFKHDLDKVVNGIERSSFVEPSEYYYRQIHEWVIKDDSKMEKISKGEFGLHFIHCQIRRFQNYFYIGLCNKIETHINTHARTHAHTQTISQNGNLILK